MTHQKKKLVVSTLFVASLAFAQQALSESSDDSELFSMSLEELLKVKVVTAASGVEQSISDAPASVSVITANEWQAAGARSLTDVLRMIPGIHVTKAQTGASKNIPSIRGISGTFGEQVLILIDGNPLKYLQDSGRFPGERLPLTAYSRIEIIRSPGSAVYGADAVGGIINLVSHQSIDDQILFRAGSFDSYDFAINTQEKWQDLTLIASLSYQQSADDKNKIVEADLQTAFDNLFNTNASKAPGILDEHYKVLDVHAKLTNERWSLSTHIWQNTDVGSGAGIAQALDPQGTVKYQQQQYNFKYNILNESDNLLTAEFFYDRSQVEVNAYVFPSGAVLPIGNDGNVNLLSPVNYVLFTEGLIGQPRSKNYISKFQLTHLIKNNNHQVRWSLGTEQHKLKTSEWKNFGPGIIDGSQLVVDGALTNVSDTPYVYIQNTDRDILFFSIQDQWKINQQWQTNLGVRFDKYSDFGSTTNPRFSLIWAPEANLNFQFFAGTAFRAPSFLDLYIKNNPSGIGNPNLQPEKIRTFETGFSSSYLVSKNLQLNFNIFNYEITDIIQFLPNTINSGVYATNSGEQKGRGAELEYSWKVNNRWLIKGHYSYLESKDKYNANTADIPNNMAYLQSHWKLNDHWQLFTAAKWIDERERPMFDTRPPLKGYTWGNAKLSWQNNNLSLGLIIDNLFDADAREPSNGSLPNDYPLKGRSYMFEVSYSY